MITAALVSTLAHWTAIKMEHPTRCFYYTNHTLIKAEHDRNFDGRTDLTEMFTGGAVSHFESDDNFDGTTDFKGQYQQGRIATSSVDVDFNGVDDLFYVYSNGVVAKATLQPNRSNQILRVQKFLHGVKVEELSDPDGDGTLNWQKKFDPFENVIEQGDVNRK
jgi:hypothetical protein